jgi:hypothetical protein
VIMPTPAALFFVRVGAALLPRGGSHQYSMYAGVAALMVYWPLAWHRTVRPAARLERPRWRSGSRCSVW